jgi:hypothetical protein
MRVAMGRNGESEIAARRPRRAPTHPDRSLLPIGRPERSIK